MSSVNSRENNSLSTVTMKWSKECFDDNWVEIGKGGFGTVYKATTKKRLLGLSSRREVALKKLERTPKTEERIRYEIQALQLLNEVRDRNSKIVRFYGVFEDEKYTTIVMEYCKEGSLRNYIFRRRKKLSNTSACFVLLQIVEGLMFMHGKGIMHRDVSANNVLISRIDGEKLYIKLCDFGLTKRTPSVPQYHTCVGTPGYIPRGVVNHQKYGFEVDIFSLGGVLYMMLVGEDPPQQGIVFDAPKMRDLSQEAKDLLRRMVKESSEERIALDDIRGHAFVKLHYGAYDDVPAQLSRGNSRERKHRHRSTSNERDSALGASEYTKDNLTQHQQRINCCRHVGALAGQRCRLCGAAVPLNTNNVIQQTLITAASVLNMPTTAATLPTALNRHYNRSESQRLLLRGGATADGDYRRRDERPPLQLKENVCPGRDDMEPRPRTATSSPVIQNKNRKTTTAPQLDPPLWPLPYISHLSLFRVTKYGRFVIRSSEEPSMVHEMANRDGEVVSIFEVYYNSTSQRFVVYNPKTRGIKLPERMEPFVEKEEPATRKYRNADDLMAGQRCDQLGYRRMTQFINLAKHRVARGKIHHIFEQPEFTLQLKYDGVVSLSSNDGSMEVYDDDEAAVSSMTPTQQVMLKRGKKYINQLAALHKQMLQDELQMRPQLTRRERYAIYYRPFSVTWNRFANITEIT